MLRPDTILALTSAWNGPWVAMIASAALAALLVLTVVLLARRNSRRRREGEVREIVRTLEEIRSGRRPQPAQVESSSPLAIVADAVHRLGQEAGGRVREAESARRRMIAVTEALDDAAVITTDLDGDVRTFSSGAETLFGWTADQVLARSAAALFEENAYKEFLPLLVPRALRESGVRARSRMRRADGGDFPADVTVRPLPEGGGYLIVLRDAGTLERLEQASAKAAERYEQLIAAFPDGIAVVVDGKLVSLNPAAAEMFGGTPDELVGQPLRDRIPTRDLIPVNTLLGRVVAGEAAGDLVTGILDAAGLERARVRLTAGPTEHDGTPAVRIWMRDETLQEQVTAELRRNESRLDAVLEASEEGLVVLSGSGRQSHIRMTNRAFAGRFGLETRQLLGMSLPQLQATLRGHSSGGREIAERIAAPDGRPVEIVFDGEPPRRVEVVVDRLTDRDGNTLGRIVTCRDRSDRERSENALQQAAEGLRHGREELEEAHRGLQALHDDLTRRTSALEELNEELRSINVMKSELLGNVAHELQTPLVAIRGYTEMIHKGRLGPISDEQRRGLATALTNIDRLIGMIDGLLAFARQESEIGAVSLSRFGLGELVRECADLLAEPMTAARVSFQPAVAPELTVHADREKIFQVVLNLLTNAVKFNRPGGAVRIAARREGERVEVQVSDQGVGIPREDLDRIFDRSFRSANTGDAEGSGYGLAIVRDLLRLHGSRIHVTSEPGKGTTFSFRLPLAPPVPSGSPQPPEPASDPPVTPAAEEGRDASPDPTSRLSRSDPKEPEPGPADGAPLPRFRVIRHKKPDEPA